MESITAGSMPEGNVDGGWNRHCGQGNSQRTEGKETHKVEGQFYWCPGSQGWVTRAPQTGRPMDPWLISNLSIASRSSLHAGLTRRSRQSASATTLQRMTPTQSSGCSTRAGVAVALVCRTPWGDAKECFLAQGDDTDRADNDAATVGGVPSTQQLTSGAGRSFMESQTAGGNGRRRLQSQVRHTCVAVLRRGGL